MDTKTSLSKSEKKVTDIQQNVKDELSEPQNNRDDNQITFADIEESSQSNNVDSSRETFGCCSRYRECSLIGKCLHTDEYHKQCSYRKNIELGNIFYSKNASEFSQQRYDYIAAFHKSLDEQHKKIFDSIIIYFNQTKRGCTSCFCVSEPAINVVVNSFKGFIVRSPESIMRRLFDENLITIKKAKQLHAKYSKLPAPDITAYPPPLSKKAKTSDKSERDKIVKEIRAKNRKAWIEHFLKDPDLLNAISSKFIYFELADYDLELDEFYMDNRYQLFQCVSDLIVFNSSSSTEFVDIAETIIQ